MNLTYSAIIPAFNAVRTLQEAIQSIAGQTRKPELIVVVDDGSADGTGALACECRAHVIRQANQGPGAACNEGLKIVETPVVAYLDADDLWLPDKMERQLQALEEDATLSAVFGRTRLFHHEAPKDTSAPVRDNWGRTVMAIRTADMRAIGPLFDPPGRDIAVGIGDTVDWVARGREAGYRFLMMPEIVALRRVIPGSLSYGYNARDMGYLHVRAPRLGEKTGESRGGRPGRMKQERRGRGWPDPHIHLLLRALLSPEAQARQAWAAWLAIRDFDDVTWEEMRLLAPLALEAPRARYRFSACGRGLLASRGGCGPRRNSASRRPVRLSMRCPQRGFHLLFSRGPRFMLTALGQSRGGFLETSTSSSGGRTCCPPFRVCMRRGGDKPDYRSNIWRGSQAPARAAILHWVIAAISICTPTHFTFAGLTRRRKQTFGTVPHGANSWGGGSGFRLRRTRS